MIRALLPALALFVGLSDATHASDHQLSITDRVDGLTHMEGFKDLYWDAATGELLLKIDALGEDFIYQSSLARGVGSNDLLLDRGQLGALRLVEFQRSGPRVLLVEKNTWYRASADSPQEQRAIDSSFPDSVVWGFEVLAEDAGSVLVDATSFFLRDAHDLSTRLKRAKQGSYSVDAGHRWQDGGRRAIGAGQ